MQDLIPTAAELADIIAANYSTLMEYRGYMTHNRWAIAAVAALAAIMLVAVAKRLGSLEERFERLTEIVDHNTVVDELHDRRFRRRLRKVEEKVGLRQPKSKDTPAKAA